MSFFEFFSQLSWFGTFIFGAIVVILIKLLVSLIFSPITSRLDILIKIMKEKANG